MATITNYIINPVFHTDTTGAVEAAATLARTTEQTDLHPTALSITPNGGASSQGVQMKSLEGIGMSGTAQTFVASFSAIAPMSLRCWVRALYDDASFTDGSILTVTTSGEPERLTAGVVTVEAGKTLNYFRVMVRTAVSTTTPFVVSRFLIHEGDEAVDYFDGDSPNAAWTGTPHASTSVLTIPDTAPRPSRVFVLGQPHIGPLRVGRR